MSSRRRGFGAMAPERVREIAALGGKAAHAKGVAHQWTSEEAHNAGKLGGVATSADRAHMADIGRKGGASCASNRAHMAEIGRRGGNAWRGDSEHMRELGRKGGAATKARIEAAKRSADSVPPSLAELQGDP